MPASGFLVLPTVRVGEVLDQIIANLGARQQAVIPEVKGRGGCAHPVPVQYPLEAFRLRIRIKGVGIVSQCFAG